MNTTSKPPTRQGIQSVEVGARLLTVLAEHNQAMMLKDLARGAGMPPAKAHRYLTSYIRCGLVRQDRYTGRYDLGAFALQLGLSSLARLDIIRAADPILEGLCEKISETVALAVWGTHGATVVRMFEPLTTITVSLRAGSVLPLTRSATGRCFAVFSDSPAVRRALEAELRDLAARDEIGAAQLGEKLEVLFPEIREHGIARASGSLTLGINGFSAPVFDYAGSMVAALTSLGAVDHFDESWTSPIASELRLAAALLSRQLGYTAQPQP
jgi:DNA-binding IclR family transcriptional regulator